jgi:hypothetical protein
MPVYIGGTSGIAPPSWDTAGRPSSPLNGQMGWNTTLGLLECWTGTTWTQVTSQLYAALYLIAAGGGGGAGLGAFTGGGGGGGGAGGALSGSTSFVSGTTYAIVVGAGGAGGLSPNANSAGAVGTASTFNAVSTVGGGGGGDAER